MPTGALIPNFQPDDLAAIALVFAKILLIVVALVFLISGLDDFFVDICYVLRGIYRRLFVLPKHPRVTATDLEAKAEQPIAILVPAWNESAVIRQMLLNAVTTFDYENYQIFVGTYPNDEATEREVELVRERYENVQRVVCPHNGPTNKADCLNWIYQGILHFERENGVHFEIFVMHDSEDIVHPTSLRFFNYLMPRKHMIQLPVFALEHDTWSFTGGHYIDEFAEHHRKNMVVREALSGRIPSAGVGCAFSREAFEKMSEARKGQIFNLQSMTEDYDFGMNIQPLGLTSIFAKFPVDRRMTQVSKFSGRKYDTTKREYIGTREYFPNRPWAAIKQRARWIVGIAFQGWSQLGWRGGFWSKYQLLQDRKQLVTGFFNVLGYVVLGIVLAVQIHNWLVPDSYRYPSLVDTHSWLWTVILIDTFFMFDRFFWRAYCVQRSYGWRQAILSIPRQVWGNFIGFAAVCRAFYLFIRSKFTGRRITWEKTDHAFPNEKELLAFRRRLGDLLLDRRLITVGQLDTALQQQTRTRKPLGRILIQSGLLQEQQLTKVLAAQQSLPTVALDPYKTPMNLLEMLPYDLSIRHSIYPVRNGSKNGNGNGNGHTNGNGHASGNGKTNGNGNGNGKRLQVACENALSPAVRQELEDRLHLHIEVCLATRNDVAFAIRRGYERLARQQQNVAENKHLGEILIELGMLTEPQLTSALAAQRETYRRLGDVLADRDLLNADHLQRAATEFDPYSGHFGEFLVKRGFISRQQLDEALLLQSSSFRKIGEVLVTQGLISPNDLARVLHEA